MKRTYDQALKANVILDDDGQVRGIHHQDEYPEIKNLRGSAAAKAYLHNVAGKLKIAPESLRNLDSPVAYDDPMKKDVEFHLSEEKTFFDTTTFAYYQTYLNTPVWGSGITVTVKNDPSRLMTVTNTSQSGMDAKLPASKEKNLFLKLFKTGEKVVSPTPKAATKSAKSKKDASDSLLDEILANRLRPTKERHVKARKPRLIRGRFFVYRYDAKRRTYDHPPQHAGGSADTTHDEHPTLPLAPVPKSIKDGQWCMVAELVIRLPYKHEERMNWRMLVDLKTRSILYLRSLSSGLNGLVFRYDPITSTGDNTNSANRPNAVLNSLRDNVVLENLNPPMLGMQSLTGSLVTVNHVDPPNIAGPVLPANTDFNFNARSNDFAAVNAYYHNDRFFRLVEELGFPLATYFDGTSFPVDIDHRGFSGANNAHCIGDGDGIAHACYGLIDNTGGTPVGNALEWSVVLHELAGHGILYDHVGSANFGFSHSAGDSFAIILNDFASAWHNGGAIDRFVRSPFRQNLRRSDRTVAAGWGWGGVNDDGSYRSEQILSTTMFRVYRSIGGDSTRLTRREFAARMMTYLMLRAVGTLTPLSNPNNPAQFLDALLTADAGNWTTEGLIGGVYGKVFSWSFEKQDLNDGDPPIVDVYIDDGRGGEYEFLPDHTDTASVWNRNSPIIREGHQEPINGTNYAFVKIKNRGTSVADNVVVRAFHSKPGAGFVWPNDFQPMTTPELPAGSLQPNDAEEKIIGPFAWTPAENATGHDTILMIVSATGDSSNIDNFAAGEEIEDWRLVPNDNNIAMRHVELEPRLVTVIADSGDFGDVCLGDHKDMTLVLSNSGFNMLTVSNITSSSPEFLVPSVLFYPIVIEAGNTIEIHIRLNPSSLGAKAATISVFSDDPDSPKEVKVSGFVGAPRLVTLIANSGNFGKVCRDTFKDQMLTLSNSGKCTLTVNSIISSSAEFVVPDVVSYPITIEAGNALQVPIRFEPNSLGAKSAEITINSDDPEGPKTVKVFGKVPAGKIVITGSTCIGGVKAGCLGERTITICNVGDCKLKVSKVALKRKRKHWKLINNPFPANLQPGSCLDVLIRYKAKEKCPKSAELVILSNDPKRPKIVLDLMAYTAWDNCGCKNCCKDCHKGCCKKKHHDSSCCIQGIDGCCDGEGKK